MNASPAMPEDQAPACALRRWLLVFASIAICGALAAITLYLGGFAWAGTFTDPYCTAVTHETVQDAFAKHGFNRAWEPAPRAWIAPWILTGIGLLGELVIAALMLGNVKRGRPTAQAVLLTVVIIAMAISGGALYRIQQASKVSTSLLSLACITSASGELDPTDLDNVILYLSSKGQWPYADNRVLSLLFALSGSSGLIWLAATRRPRIRKAPPAL